MSSEMSAALPADWDICPLQTLTAHVETTRHAALHSVTFMQVKHGFMLTCLASSPRNAKASSTNARDQSELRSSITPVSSPACKCGCQVTLIDDLHAPARDGKPRSMQARQAHTPCWRSLWLTDSSFWYASSRTSLAEPQRTRSLPSYLVNGILKPISSHSTSWSANKTQPARAGGMSANAWVAVQSCKDWRISGCQTVR
jgi:hypothetical protein